MRFGELSDDENMVHTFTFDEKASINLPVQDLFSPTMLEKTDKASESLASSAAGLLNQEQFEKILKTYQSSIANKFLNPYTFSIFGLYYAYKGSLGKIERILLGAGALAALFFIIKKQEEKGQLSMESLYNEYVSQVTPKGLMDITKA
jgi:hypothetical protein